MGCTEIIGGLPAGGAVTNDRRQCGDEGRRACQSARWHARALYGGVSRDVRPQGRVAPCGRRGGHVHARDASSARTGGASAQSEKRQDGEDDDDETNEIDDVVHGVPFHWGARLTACATSRALTIIACARRAPAVQRPHGLSTAGLPRRGSLTASPRRWGWRAARTRCCCSSGRVSWRRRTCPARVSPGSCP
jgi:hypothetical protein